jgi:hypothetical protein
LYLPITSHPAVHRTLRDKAAISPTASVFSGVPDKYFKGEHDPSTVKLIKAA